MPLPFVFSTQVLSVLVGWLIYFWNGLRCPISFSLFHRPFTTDIWAFISIREIRMINAFCESLNFRFCMAFFTNSNAASISALSIFDVDSNQIRIFSQLLSYIWFRLFIYLNFFTFFLKNNFSRLKFMLIYWANEFIKQVIPI